MAPRSNWKGYLKLSLVSASIAIYPATSSTEKVRFNTLNRATGNRLKRQMVDSVTGDVVENEDMVKGYAVGQDQYVQVGDDELAEIAIESSHTVDIEKFVPKASIDDRYRDTPYYLAPEDKVGQEAFAVIRDAMKKKKMVGIARVVMARRERIMMLEPFGKGIMGTLLLYPYEIRSEEGMFEEIPEMKLPDQMIGLAGSGLLGCRRLAAAFCILNAAPQRIHQVDDVGRARGRFLLRRRQPTRSNRFQNRSSVSQSTHAVEGWLRRQFDGLRSSLHPHAIGLDHPDSSGEIMDYRYGELFRELQPGDVAGVVLLYGPHVPEMVADTKAHAPIPRPSPPRLSAEHSGARALPAPSHN
jgi:Ku protein